MNSLGCLGFFLLAGKAGSEGISPEEKTQEQALQKPDRSCLDFPELASNVIEGHFLHILFIHIVLMEGKGILNPISSYKRVKELAAIYLNPYIIKHLNNHTTVFSI